MVDSDDSSEGSDAPRVPTAVDLMAGVHQPVSQALRSLGWTVKAYDWAIDPSHDLSLASV